MELLLMDVPVGNLICRLSRTDRYEFPQNIDTFALDFIPLLQLAWVGKEAMKETVEVMKKRKRKEVALLNYSENDPAEPSTHFPCSFYFKTLKESKTLGNDEGAGSSSSS
ncbi:hypothetical protein EDC94DRAFT_392454 [Helicostylum pulchrum]|nr:hypothetical protein EDC94DRAFT_392454 [Helicostylum pulchrum]